MSDSMAKSIESYMPLSETAYYILLSLKIPRHGYGIIKYVDELTNGRIVLGSGTIYTTLGKVKKSEFISVYQDQERKTVYELTAKGERLLELEVERIKKIYKDTLKVEEIVNED